LHPAGIAKLSGELAADEQLRLIGQGGGGDDPHFRGVLFQELLHLKDEHSQEWIEQERQNDNGEKGSPVAQLVAELAEED
jgi:hypothetical protein